MQTALINGLRIAALSLLVAVSGTIAARAQDDGSHVQTAAGILAYIGVVPAEIVKGHPAGHSEQAMHGGPPAKSHEHHLIVAPFDASSGARITDATVSVTIFGPGNTLLYGQRHMPARGTPSLVKSLPRIPLEPMSIAGTITYGGFFTLPEPALYTIQVSVLRPGKRRAAILNFTYDTRS